MYLDQTTAETIAARFKNKFQSVQYAGCWNNNTISFYLYQDAKERAGVHITISKETDSEGHPPKDFKITQVQRIFVSTSNPHRNNPTIKEKLPILIM